MKPLAVLSVASEAFPFVKTGGLADVVGALPGALAAEGVAVRTLVPGYPGVLAALPVADVALELPDFYGGDARLVAGRAAGLDVVALDAPHLYARPGNPYLGPDGREWPDNALRFAPADSDVDVAILCDPAPPRPWPGSTRGSPMSSRRGPRGWCRRLSARRCPRKRCSTS